LAATSTGVGTATVNGTLASVPNTTIRIDFYSGPKIIGNGPQAAVFLGFQTVTTDASGNASFSMDVAGLSPVDGVTATATDTKAGGEGTSEFAAVAIPAALPTNEVTSKTPFTFTDANGDTVRVKLTGAGKVNVVLVGAASDNADIDTLTLVETNLTSK